MLTLRQQAHAHTHSDVDKINRWMQLNGLHNKRNVYFASVQEIEHISILPLRFFLREVPTHTHVSGEETESEKGTKLIENNIQPVQVQQKDFRNERNIRSQQESLEIANSVVYVNERLTHTYTHLAMQSMMASVAAEAMQSATTRKAHTYPNRIGKLRDREKKWRKRNTNASNDTQAAQGLK